MNGLESTLSFDETKGNENIYLHLPTNIAGMSLQRRDGDMWVALSLHVTRMIPAASRHPYCTTRGCAVAPALRTRLSAFAEIAPLSYANTSFPARSTLQLPRGIAWVVSLWRLKINKRSADIVEDALDFLSGPGLVLWQRSQGYTARSPSSSIQLYTSGLQPHSHAGDHNCVIPRG